MWAVGRLGVAACLACVVAAAVDRQARQSCRVWCAGVNWTIALNVSRLKQFFCRRQSLSCRVSSSRRRGRHDTDRTVLSGLAWRCEWGITVKAKFHYTDPTRTRHGPDPTRTKSVHVVGYELNSTTRTRHGPARTRTDFFCGETPLGPCGSGRVRVVEFSYN